MNSFVFYVAVITFVRMMSVVIIVDLFFPGVLEFRKLKTRKYRIKTIISDCDLWYQPQYKDFLFWKNFIFDGKVVGLRSKPCAGEFIFYDKNRYKSSTDFSHLE